MWNKLALCICCFENRAGATKGRGEESAISGEKLTDDVPKKAGNWK